MLRAFTQGLALLELELAQNRLDLAAFQAIQARLFTIKKGEKPSEASKIHAKSPPKRAKAACLCDVSSSCCKVSRSLALRALELLEKAFPPISPTLGNSSLEGLYLIIITYRSDFKHT